ncbi:MAG TPA: leucyl aminopeptidase [Ktedonobacterales bacterium]|jgi:leucyl aminopeptidase
MDIHIASTSVTSAAADAVIVGIFKGGQSDALEGPAAALDTALDGALAAMRRAGELAGSANETTVVHTLGKLSTPRLVLVGLGPRKECSFESVRRAAAAGCRAARKAGARHVALALWWPDLAHLGIGATHAADAQTEGALYGLYEFKKYKSNHDNGDNHKRVEQITLLGEDAQALGQGSERGRVIAEAVSFCRDLGNEPPNVLTPTEFANRSRAMAETVGLECEILEREQMQELGMGCLLGVASGSAQPPKLIILRYKGDPGGAPGLALVGKGITFDTGGISIKPAAGMEAMKMDMCGAAAVIAAMQAIAQLKPKINVTALAPATENMPGGNAYRPGDILRAMNGKTVEIVNTDAEGRLVLADALSYARAHHLAPIVDAATLTGAMVVALGSVRAGIFGNDEALAHQIQEIGEEIGERFWTMPMDEDYDELIKSDVADVRQSVIRREAGSIGAARILGRFAEGAPWAHLDIAGVNDFGSAKPYADRGASGIPVRTFVALAERLAK